VIELLAPLGDLLQIAHETQFPHQEPVKGDGGGASPVVILAGIVVTLAVVAGLVWVKKRTDREQEG
jgi:hypothetical protein